MDRAEYRRIDYAALVAHLREIPEPEREPWIAPFLWVVDHQAELLATLPETNGFSLNKLTYDDGHDRGVIIQVQMFIPHSSVPHRN